MNSESATSLPHKMAKTKATAKKLAAKADRRGVSDEDSGDDVKKGKAKAKTKVDDIEYVVQAV